MFCEKCGAKLEPDSLFCSTCGAKVITYEDPIPQNNTSYEDDTVRVGEYQDQADPVWNNAPQQPQAPAWNNAPQQPQAPAWNTPSRASAPAGAAGKSSGYTVGLILGIAAYAALILSFFIAFVGTKSIRVSAYGYSYGAGPESYSLLQLAKLTDYTEIGPLVYIVLALCALVIIWLLIPKRWAAIIGAVWSANIITFTVILMIAFGAASKAIGYGTLIELKFGAWLMLIAGIIMLVACIMRAVTVNRRKAALTYY